jgi:hypothetical protein
VPQILAVSPEQIKSIKPRLTAPEQEVFELGFAMAVEADNLAIEDCRPGTQLGR